MLKLIIDTLDGLSEEVQKLYVKKEDEKFHLDVDNPFKTQVAEFRTNNIALLKDKEKLTADLLKFKDIDPSKAKDALEKLQLIADKELIGKGKIEELLTQRTERMKQNYDNQIAAMNTSKDELTINIKGLKEKLSVVTIDNAIQMAVSEDAVPVKGAMSDIISRGRSVFSLDDKGGVVALDDKGGIRYSKDGSNSLSIKEWAQNLSTDAPFLFEPSDGVGSKGGAGAGGAGGKKIVSKSDPKAMSANIKEIADGTVSVQ